MCTCLALKSNNTYFGRNLDLESSFNEMVVITPRKFPLTFKKEKTLKEHYAIIGMATIINNYPLYAEATNEHGLSIAGLEFEGNAKYFKSKVNHLNLGSFELIPYILGTCKDIREFLELSKKLNILDLNFSTKVVHSNLHWMIADKKECYVIESTKEGLKVYKNPYGVLTNNPPFPFHLDNVKLYLNVTKEVVESRFSDSLTLTSFTTGMGTYGLPGDFTSPSRFVKATYLLNNCEHYKNESENVSNFFHILGSVSFPKGSVLSKTKENHYTIYSSCINVNKGIYYFKTYNNSRISSVSLDKCDYKSDKLIFYPISDKEDIKSLN